MNPQILQDKTECRSFNINLIFIFQLIVNVRSIILVLNDWTKPSKTIKWITQFLTTHWSFVHSLFKCLENFRKQIHISFYGEVLKNVQRSAKIGRESYLSLLLRRCRCSSLSLSLSLIARYYDWLGRFGQSNMILTVR